MITSRKQIQSKILSVLAAIVVLVAAFVLPLPNAQAAQITGRKLTLSNSAGTATGVTYTLTMTLPSATVLQSAEAVICTTASGSCSIPSGFSNASSTLSSQPTNLGDASGWSVNTSTSGKLRLKKTGNSAAPTGTTTVTFGNVTNPTANNSTFYARITTYSDDAWTTPVDTGTVAASTASQITVTASVDETLTFCAGTSITGTNCGTISGSSVSLGTLTDSTTGSGTSVMAASTNAVSGYAITINGSTLTSGGNTIDAITAGSGSPSSQGTEQFGVNLRDNTTPNVGSDPTDTTNLTYGTGYGTVDSFKFVTGNTVASKSAASNSTAYTVSYIANVGGATEPGTYTGTYTYICTATF